MLGPLRRLVDLGRDQPVWLYPRLLQKLDPARRPGCQHQFLEYAHRISVADRECGWLSI
jgi:hypothetical protein